MTNPSTRSYALTTLGVATVVALVGCSSTSTGQAHDTPSPSPSGLHTHEHQAGAPSDDAAGWTPVSRQQAVALGVSVMERFARPDLPPETWWEDLVGDLSPQARQAYQFVGPANVPATRVTGPGELVDLGSAEVAVVHVPTDVGQYALTVTRAGTGNQMWLVDRITPPDGGEH